LSDGRVEGTDSLGARRNDVVQAPIDYCVPPVRTRVDLVPCQTTDARPDHLLVFRVAPSDGTVYANTKDDDVYLRVRDETRRLSFAQRQELMFDRKQGS